MFCSFRICLSVDKHSHALPLCSPHMTIWKVTLPQGSSWECLPLFSYCPISQPLCHPLTPAVHSCFIDSTLPSPFMVTSLLVLSVTHSQSARTFQKKLSEDDWGLSPELSGHYRAGWDWSQPWWWQPNQVSLNKECWKRRLILVEARTAQASKNAIGKLLVKPISNDWQKSTVRKIILP